MNEFLKKINYGYDGLIRSIKLHSFSMIEITISVMDSENQNNWINVHFIADKITEFKINQKLNTSNIVMSGGIKYMEINDILYLDFAPYSEEITTIEDLRHSDIYFGCSSMIHWIITKYDDK